MKPGPVKPARRGKMLGLVAGLASMFAPKAGKITPDELMKHDYRSSTQRMGVRFTTKVRDAFRRRWIKIHR